MDTSGRLAFTSLALLLLGSPIASNAVVEELTYRSPYNDSFELCSMAVDDGGIYLGGRINEYYSGILWSSDGVSWSRYDVSAGVSDNRPRTPWEVWEVYHDIELSPDRILLVLHGDSFDTSGRTLRTVDRSTGTIVSGVSADDYDCPVISPRLLRSGDSVYVGAGPRGVDSLRLYEGDQWTTVGDPLVKSRSSCESFCICGTFTAADVWALAATDGGLLVAGSFGDGGASAMGELVGGEWDLGRHQANGTVARLQRHGGDIVAIGDFTAINGAETPGPARYDGTAWSPLLSEPVDSSQIFFNLYSHQGTLYLASLQSADSGQWTCVLWALNGSRLRSVCEFAAESSSQRNMEFGIFRGDLIVTYRSRLYRIHDSGVETRRTSLGSLKATFKGH
jgi:hypothetical protein